MDDNTFWLLVKIGITIASLVFLWIFKKHIMRLVTDLIVGGDTKVYEDKTYDQIRSDMERKLDEVLR